MQSYVLILKIVIKIKKTVNFVIFIKFEKLRTAGQIG